MTDSDDEPSRYIDKTLPVTTMGVIAIIMALAVAIVVATISAATGGNTAMLAVLIRMAQRVGAVAVLLYLVINAGALALDVAVRAGEV